MTTATTTKNDGATTPYHERKYTTIRRNWTRKLDAIFAVGHDFVCHRLDNGFKPEATTGEWVRKELFGSLHASMSTCNHETYTVQVHSNLWYKFSTV